MRRPNYYVAHPYGGKHENVDRTIEVLDRLCRWGMRHDQNRRNFCAPWLAYVGVAERRLFEQMEVIGLEGDDYRAARATLEKELGDEFLGRDLDLLAGYDGLILTDSMSNGMVRELQAFADLARFGPPPPVLRAREIVDLTVSSLEWFNGPLDQWPGFNKWPRLNVWPRIHDDPDGERT